MKVIGKDLIFTDPCYIAKDADWGDSFDYEVEGIGYPGFTEYEWEDTGYGDGSPKVYSIPTYYNPDEFLIKVINADENELEELEDLKEYIGECGVDSGTFGVFLLDEVLKYNPSFDYHLNKPWTTTLIKDFEGDIKYYIDLEGQAHILGSGNTNFCTIQTGF